MVAIAFDARHHARCEPTPATYARSASLARRSSARPGRSDVEADLSAAFGTWCIDQRGLAPVTTDQYVERMAGFLAMWHPHGEPVLSELDGASVLATIRAASIVMPAPSLRCMVTALRSFLRFAYVTGRVPAPLVTAVPSLKAWPRTALPSAIPPADARRLVDSCDTSTARGRRDAAVLLVLIRLGLRASEVARLDFEDFDWRRGEVMINAKGGHGDVMPLEVGEAVADYLCAGRPSAPSRSAFLTRWPRSGACPATGWPSSCAGPVSVPALLRSVRTASVTRSPPRPKSAMLQELHHSTWSAIKVL